MSRDKFKEWCKKERGMLANDETQSWMLSAWLGGRESMRDEAADKYWSAYQSDLEYGIKSSNEREAKLFNEKYPKLSKFGGWINQEDIV